MVTNQIENSMSYHLFYIISYRCKPQGIVAESRPSNYLSFNSFDLDNCVTINYKYNRNSD